MKVKALKRVSVRDSLAKTVKLLTKQGINVQFRGSRAFVETRGDKVLRMVLPEIDDTASEELLAALHGYLDHECGHIFYTPFGKNQKFMSEHRKELGQILNIVEDIRLEKLLPRDLPGTKENLARLYEKVIPEIMAPHAAEQTQLGDKSKAFASVMIPGLRALAGQRAFKVFMDQNNYWPLFAPLLAKMPDLARRLRDMETAEDARQIALSLLEELVKQTPPEDQPDFSQMNDKDEDDDQQSQNDEEDDGEPGDEEGEADSEETEGEDSDESDEDGEDGAEGEDDDEGGEDPDADTEPSDEKKSKKGDDQDDGDGDSDDDQDDDSADEEGAGDGKTNVSITDALKQLDPTQRKAIYLYKRERKSIREIAESMEQSEDDVRELIRTGRRRLNEIITGG